MFLYKAVEGISKQSHGYANPALVTSRIICARKAGVPESVVERAQVVAEALRQPQQLNALISEADTIGHMIDRLFKLNTSRSQDVQAFIDFLKGSRAQKVRLNNAP